MLNNLNKKVKTRKFWKVLGKKRANINYNSKVKEDVTIINTTKFLNNSTKKEYTEKKDVGITGNDKTQIVDNTKNDLDKKKEVMKKSSETSEYPSSTGTDNYISTKSKENCISNSTGQIGKSDDNYFENHDGEEFILIKKNKNNCIEKISLKIIRNLIDKKKYSLLSKYSFPYIVQKEFNQKIFNISLKEFRRLLFYCPICKKNYRHFSMSYHIFQYHFKYRNIYLNQREIANGCAKILEKEYNKIKTSLELFGQISLLFQDCQCRNASIWRMSAKNEKDEIQKLNIKKKYFSYQLEDAIKSLEKKLPLNIN